ADQIEQRRLASSVRTDQPDNAAGLENEIDAIGDDDPVETFAHAFDFEHTSHQRGSAGLADGARQISFAGTRPWGRKNMNTSTRPVNRSPWIGPRMLGGRARKLIACGMACSNNAPMTGPQ